MSHSNLLREKNSEGSSGEENASGDYDAAASKALVRKQDLHLMPLAIWMYLLAYLDRSNIGNAKVLNKASGHDLLNTLGITEHQYKIALMLFFVAYILFETPSNWALKKLRPSRWISVIIFLWGICTMCLGSVQNFPQLAVVRFLLGATEAGLFPGLVTILTFWYRPEERTLRVALILASASFAGAFSGALATGISYLEGVSGLEAWRWLFIIEGLPAVLTAPIIYFCYPDWPETATWLTEEERVLAAKRLAGDNGSHGSYRMTWTEAKAVLVNWRLYLYYLAYIGICVPSSSLSLFTPTIVSNMGYDHGIQANLFSVPPYAVAWVITVMTAYAADRYNARALATSVTASIGAIAFAVQGGLPEGHYVARYIVLIIATSGGFACTPPLLAWLSANVRGTTGATLAIPLSISCGGIGQIIGVWIFKADEAPQYRTGQFTNFAFLLMTSIVATGLQLSFRQLNRNNILRGEGKTLFVY